MIHFSGLALGHQNTEMSTRHKAETRALIEGGGGGGEYLYIRVLPYQLMALQIIQFIAKENCFLPSKKSR